MQIVLKIAPSHRDRGVDLVNGLVAKALSKDEAERASVEVVFPGVTAGRRAGMLVLSLDDAVPAHGVAKVLDSLRESEAIEYARAAAPRAATAGET
ncbi:MAG TPA: hypothetical protein VGS57_12645 [Thermoanaerobaculia bacterium]|jgi:beta-phosphoglucomutase-like phosphatase (HAD superfamily)|nr:hypothetical protein [Thermoanaerobaculia bacterium]